jgi:hypothetical protein
MGNHAYSGESPQDRAGNKMDKQLAKLARHAKKQKAETIVDQIKRLYPENWRVVLSEMIKEDSDPEYKKRKEAARVDYTRRYYIEVPPYQRVNGFDGERAWVAKKMMQWITEQTTDESSTS